MNYSEWLNTVPSEITNDPIWKLEVYRLALFSSDIGWPDVNAIYKNHLMQRLANQLYGSLGSISANLTEGFSRSKGLDRARCFEYSLGSSRESRECYYKARHVNPLGGLSASYGLAHEDHQYASSYDSSPAHSQYTRGTARVSCL